MKMNRTRYGWQLGIAALMLLIAASAALAALDITNVDATVEKRRNQSTGRDEAWVIVTYNIADVPAQGAVVTMKASFRKGDTGVSFTDKPVTAELSGDVGAITTGGAKVMEWHAEQTLMRLNKQGKYRCFITLEVEGQDSISKATLVVRKYVESSWYYFRPGTAVIKNLRRTGTFTPSCPNVQGQSWHQTVEAGAVFYQGEVESIPAWNGRRQNDNMSGTPSSSGCSAFLAVKDQGTADEKVWVNFSQLWDMVLNLEPKQFFQWEFQFRYFHKKSDGSKALKCGNAGKPGQDVWSEDNLGEDFELTMESGPAERENSNTFDLEVVRREYKHFHQGTHVMTFTALDTAYFEDPGNGTLALQGGVVKINNWLHVSGSFTIDTAHAMISTAGAWSDPNGNLLWAGPYIAKLTDKIGTDLTSTFPVLSDGLKIGGFAVKFDSIQFVGGVDNATGVQMDITIEMKQLKSGCKWDFEADTSGDAKAGLKLKGVKLTTAGWDITGIEAKDIGMTMAPSFCLKSFKALYDKATKKLDVELVASGPMFEEMGGGMSIIDTDIDGLNFKMKLQTGVPIPYPPPPAHIMEWKGFAVDAKNVTKGPYTLSGTAFFTNRSDWDRFPQFTELAKKFKLTPTLLELDGGLEYVYGQGISLTGAARMFGLSGVFQLTGTAKATLNLSANYIGIGAEFDVKAGTLDGTNYVFNVNGKGAMGIHPSFILSASLNGSVSIPTLPTSIPFAATFNSLFGLPYMLGSASVGLYNSQVTFETSSPTAGKRSVTVEIGELPSPTAFHWSNSAPVKATRLKESDNALQSIGDTTWSEFPTSIDMDRVFIVVWGDATYPVTALRDPSGLVHVATATDSSVIYIAPVTAGGNGLWVIKEPGGGLWNVGIVDKTEGDSVAIEGLFRERPDFVLATERAGSEITARWNNVGRTENSEISLFLDVDQEGFDGIFVGSTDEASGEYRFTLSDSLPDCGYYVYGVRNTGGRISSDYSETYYDFPKTFLQPPSNIVATATNDGNVVVTWDKSPDPKALAYLIKVTDQTGRDSIYTSESFTYTMTSIHVTDWQQKTISMRTLGDGELRGCWSDPVGFVLADVDDVTGGRLPRSPLRMHVAPNPATERATVFVNLNRDGMVIIELFSVDGRKVRTLLASMEPAGTVRTDIDLTTLATGAYLVRVTTTEGNGVEKVVVR